MISNDVQVVDREEAVSDSVTTQRVRTSPDILRVGVIGYGYWGPNIVRNFQSLEKATVAAVCDRNPGALARVSRAYPGLHVTTDFFEIVHSPDIDVVAVVTPVWTHFELAKAALENGKHVFVEKPFTSTPQQAEELIALAERKNLKIMVDHTFLFGGAVRKIKEIVASGTLGPLYYFDSTRVNLGLFQHDVSVVWDSAPHDLSVMDDVIDERPEAVVATGSTHLNGHADMAFITVYFPSNIIAHINVNWLSPVKYGRRWSAARTRCWCGTTSKPTKRSRSTIRASRSAARRRPTICWSAIARATFGRRRSIRPKP